MGRVSTSSPARDAERRRAGGTVLDAVLERVTYANDETGYTIARVATDRSGADLVTVVGALLGVQPGESLRLVGRWGSHPRYGRQFEVHSFTTVLPATVQGIERYLGSGLIKGIGPRMGGPLGGPPASSRCTRSRRSCPPPSRASSGTSGPGSSRASARGWRPASSRTS